MGRTQWANRKQFHRLQICSQRRTGAGANTRGLNKSGKSLETVILGLGNTLHSDDGLGPRAVEKLRSDRRIPDGVAVIDGGTLGLELLPYVWDCSRLLVLDSVDVR